MSSDTDPKASAFKRLIRDLGALDIADVAAVGGRAVGDVIAKISVASPEQDGSGGRASRQDGGGPDRK